jgi:hypothetical protein
MSNLPPPFNDGLFSKTQGVVSSPAWRQWFGKLQTSVNTIITNIAVTGTGLVHIVNGVIQSAASLITNGDVSASAGITESKLALNYPTHPQLHHASHDTGQPDAIAPGDIGAVVANGAIAGATNTKITYDAKGLVTSGAAATTADIADSTDKRYCTDAQKVVIGNTSNTNTGDQTLVGLGGVPTTLTVNGKALSANITLGLASADYANQGSTTTVLHGNAAGNPAFGAVVEADITLANNTTNNVSITKHGFCPIAPNSLTQFLRGDGGWGTPAGTGMSAPTGTGYVHITGGAEDAAAATGYLFTGMQILTSASGTYTPTAGTTAILVEVQGAGGGGGGCATNIASYASAGGGGGGGGYAKLWIASPAASYVYSVAAGANGGAAGNNPGTTANPSTFGSGPLITANGGTGGLGGASQNNSTSSNGSDGGTAIGGNLNIPGGSGTGAIYLGAGNAPVQGLGSATLLGTPGKPWAYAAGSSGQGYGSGGNGASAISSQSQQAGGKGAAGLIIVWEYK